MVSFRPSKVAEAADPAVQTVPSTDTEHRRSVADVAPEKSFLKRITPVIACGAGLFSDGYLNQIISPVNTIFSEYLYPYEYTHSSAQSNVAALVFVGEVLGIWFFGYIRRLCLLQCILTNLQLYL